MTDTLPSVPQSLGASVPPPAPTTLSRLLEKVELGYSINATPQLLLTELLRRSAYYLPILVKTHFKINDQVARDLITSSRTLGELAERLDELHNPTLFSTPV